MFGIMDIETRTVKSSEEPNEYSINGYLIRRTASRTVAVPKDYINSWESHYKCQHEGCFMDGSVECHAPENPLDEKLDSEKNLTEHYCPDHAYEAGYCICCGEFWGGIEGFDFFNPLMLCENCKEQLDTEEGYGDEYPEEKEE